MARWSGVLWLCASLLAGCVGAPTLAAGTDDAGPVALAPPSATVSETVRGAPRPRTGVHTAAPTLPLPRRGLWRLDYDEPFGGGGTAHMAQLRAVGRTVFVANSFEGLTTYQVTGSGTLDLMSPASTPRVRCTTVAANETTAYCAAPDPEGRGSAGRVFAFDVSDPRRAVLRLGGLYTTDAGPVGALALGNGRLWAAAGAGGLLAAPVDSSGALGAWSTEYAGDAFAVDVDGDRVALLDRDRGLVVMEGGAERLVAALDGPPMAVRLSGEQAAVALGSEGVRVFDLSSADPAAEAVALNPRCVVDAVDLRADLVAVGCLTGVYLYDRSGTRPRLAGFEPAYGGVRDLRFVDDGLVVADFRRITRLAVDPGGRPLLVDASWNVPFGEDGVARVGIRNPSTERVALDILVQRLEAPVRRVLLEPEEVRVETFEAAELGAAAGALSNVMTLRLRPVAVQRLRRAGQLLPVQQGSTEVRLLRTADATTARPRPRSLFPTLEVADRSGAAVTLTPGPARLVLYQPDCALMWPELMELAYQRRHGSPARPAVVVASFLDDRVTDHLRLGVLGDREIGPGVVIWPDGRREELGYDLYDELLAQPGSRNGAHWPTDYVVGVDGRVERVERAYRGRWPL